MNGDRPFLDTNVVLYAFNRGDWRQPRAKELITPAAVISVQVLNEFVSAARRKLKMSWTDVREALEAVALVVPESRPLTSHIHADAVRLSESHGYHIYDALIVASALEAKCTVLYSEDMQDGQAIGPLTICNPFR